MNQQIQPRPRVTDYQFQSPEIAEQLRMEEKIKHAKLSKDEAPSHRISIELKRRLDNVLFDIGKDFYLWELDPENNEFGELRLLKFVDGHLKNRFLANLDEVARLEFSEYIEKTNELCKSAYDKIIADTADRVQFDQDHVRNVENEIKKVRDFLSQKRAEQNMVNAENSRPARVFSDTEKLVGIHMQGWAEDDLTRSKQNLLDKKISIKKEIKGLEKEIESLNASIAPFQEKMKELESQLADDNLSENDFKNAKLSMQYNQDKIEKIQLQMSPIIEKNTILYQEIEKADNQMKLLDILIDASELKKDAFLNFPRRRERLLQRLNQILKQMDELENLRSNLNLRWREISGDNQDLVPNLGLRADSQLYFL